MMKRIWNKIARQLMKSCVAATLAALVCATPAQAQELPQGFPTTPLSSVINAMTATAKVADAARAANESRSFIDPASTRPLVLATWKNGGEYDSQDLSATLALRRPKDFAEMTAAQIMELPAVELHKAVSQLLFSRLLTQKAIEDGFTSASTEVRGQIEASQKAILQTLYYNKVMQPIVEAEEEVARREIYETNKTTDYTVATPLVIKEIWLPYMQTYTVCKGDTWTSIAKNLCDDEAAVSQFLRDDGVRFLRVPQNLPAAALRPGESVIIPIAPNEQTKVRDKGTQLAQKIKDGGNWDELAREYESHAIPGSFTPELNGMNPKIAAAIKALKQDENSAAIETSSGIHLLRVVATESKRTATYDEVRESITVPQERTQAIREKLIEKIQTEVMAKFVPKMREDLLKRTDWQDPLLPQPLDTVMAEGEGGLKYTLEEFLNELAQQGKTWTQLTADDRIKAVRNAYKVRAWYVECDARARGIDKTPECKRYMDDAVNEALSLLSYFRQYAQCIEPTEADLRKYWEEHAAEFSKPEQVKLHEIVKRINLNAAPDVVKKTIDQAKADLTALRPTLTTLAEFEAAARERSEALSTRSRGGDLGTRQSDFKGETYREEIAKLQPGEVSQPFQSGNEVILLRLDERAESGAEPFEKCANRVLESWRKMKEPTEAQELQDKLFAEYQVKINIR